ncbi:MAG TPA: SBBP repeat-containing protein, partial [Chloroflexia bacterium]|nr:SBBP repeat-containing protein [Chloroflexia bacterium]
SVVDAFVAKLNPQGTELVFSTLLGGSSADRGGDIGLDGAGNVYVAGSTTSPDFPLQNPLQDEYSDADYGMATDSFIAKLTPDGTSLFYSTYFGAEGFDSALGFDVGRDGSVYLAGSVDSPSPGFPLAGKPYQSTNLGIRSAFIAKISDAP